MSNTSDNDDIYQTFTEESFAENNTLPAFEHILKGNIGLIKVIGRGGMGEAWFGNIFNERTKEITRKVVVKIVPPGVQKASEEMDRVRDSFRLVERLQHAHICPLYSMDEDPQFGDYLVMKFIDGQSLSDFARSYNQEYNTQPPLEVLLPIVEDIADALDYAHKMGVVHRDVKPQNILLSNDKREGVQLIDFGLAATIRTSIMNVSNLEQPVSGTLVYMSPEQLRGRPQNEKSDQYSFAATIYHLLTGHPPFESGNREVLRDCVLKEPVEPIAGAASHVNDALLRALSKDGNDRFPSCKDFVVALKGNVMPVAASAIPLQNATPPAPTTADIVKRESKQFAIGLLRELWNFAKKHPLGVVIFLLLSPCILSCFCSVPSTKNYSGTPLQSFRGDSMSEAEREELAAKYSEMIQPGKKYVTDWSQGNEAGKIGLAFESYDPRSGNIQGFLFDPEDPSKKRQFAGRFDATLKSQTPITFELNSATIAYKDATTAAQRVYLSRGSWYAQLVKRGDELVHFSDNREAVWQFKPISESDYQSIIAKFDADEKSRESLIKGLVQPDKCYVANWSLKGFSGRLGLLIEQLDEERGTFSGILFDANELDRRRKFNGVFNLLRTSPPFLIQTNSDTGMDESKGTNKTNDLFLVKKNRYNWNLKIIDNSPCFEGNVSGYGIYGDVNLVFKEADFSKMKDAFEEEEKARLTLIKKLVRPGKRYVSNWSLPKKSGRLGLYVANFDETKQVFDGYLFDPNFPNLRKPFSGSVNYDRFNGVPYSIKLQKDGGVPNTSGTNPTNDLFLCKGYGYDWNFRIVDEKLAFDGYVNGYNIYGTVNLQFAEE